MKPGALFVGWREVGGKRSSEGKPAPGPARMSGAVRADRWGTNGFWRWECQDREDGQRCGIGLSRGVGIGLCWWRG